MARGARGPYSRRMIQDGKLAWAALALRNLPPSLVAVLLRAFGEPAAVLAATRAQLRNVVPEPVADAVASPVSDEVLAHTRAWLAMRGHELLAWDDPRYPQALMAIGHAPCALYYVGRIELLNAPSFAIVGSRSASAPGKENAAAFARALSDAGLCIVSGLALGIDGAAHEGALHGASSTIAVVGTGLDRVYPARHRELAHAIAEKGGIVSEFPPGTPPREFNFPRRNRLIAGLAKGVLVVEAALYSGSLITARYAGEYGRDVFAIPGSIHSPLYKGCHKLIREGAKLVQTAQDVLEELGLAEPSALQTAGEAPMSNHAVLAAMGDDPADVDVLIARSGLAADEVIAQLTELELADLVITLPGGRWQRRR